MSFNSEEKMLKRVDKLISDSGLFSRSEARLLIKSGRVSLNGETVRSPDVKTESGTAVICVDNEALCTKQHRYFMMDKPRDVLCATEDRAQKTVIDLLPEGMKNLGLFPVGRLDKDTTGLLILTNDGQYAHRVLSPKSDVEKLYVAATEIPIEETDILAFESGIVLRDGTVCKPAKLRPLNDNRCLVSVCEGKYHQVKRMLASRSKQVIDLRRIAIGGLMLDESIGAGNLREMTEIETLSVLDKKPFFETLFCGNCPINSIN